MTEKDRLVVAIDLGPETETVVSYAACVAVARGAAIRLLYVIDYLLTPPSYLSEYVEEEKKREEAEMLSWTLRLRQQGIDAEHDIVYGRLHETFLNAVGKTFSHLLVIGFKAHMIRPSSSERLIKSLKVPVLVVRGKRTSGVKIGTVAIKRILCPVDFSEGSRKAAAEAKQYASCFSADLDVSHIVPSHVIRDRWSSWKKLAEEEKKKFEETAGADATQALGAFCGEMQIGKKGQVRLGHPAEEIVALAEEGEYDLIVIGARGLSYVESVLLGGTTEAVLRTSPCPVLIIH